MPNKCDSHEQLVKDVVEVKTDVKWIVKNIEKAISKKKFWIPTIVSVIMLAITFYIGVIK